jgi:uncharacterized membrane protein
VVERILVMWTVIALASGVASLVRYSAFRHSSPDLGFAVALVIDQLD